MIRQPWPRSAAQDAAIPEREPANGSVLTLSQRARAIVVTNLTNAGLDVGRLVYARTCHRLGLFSEWTEVHS